MKHEIWGSTEDANSTEKHDFTFPDEEEIHMNDRSLDMPSLQDDPEKTKVPVGGILSCVLAIFSIAATYGWITGSWDSVETIATIIAVLIGAIAAFFSAETFGQIFLTIEAIGAFLLWIAAAIADLVMEGFLISWIFTDLLLGLFVTIPVCSFPALICTILVAVLKKIIHFR